MGEEPILDAEELRKCWEVNQKNGVAAVREREFQRQVPKKGQMLTGAPWAGGWAEAAGLDNLDIADDLGKGSPSSEVKQKPDDYELRESRERENRPTFSRK